MLRLASLAAGAKKISIILFHILMVLLGLGIAA
jgi:hypothetical protein